MVNVSAPIKIFALVGALAALVLGGGMMMMGRGQVEGDVAPIVLLKKTQATPTAAKPEPVKAKPEQQPAVKPKPKAKAKPVKPAKPAPVVAPNGLPIEIARALQKHDVVVVALWGSGGKIDALARDEAEAGADAARAGFVALNVISSGKAAEALTLEVGTVLRTPGVLLFTKPETLAIKLDGFRDRDAVAQAALNALR